MQAVSFPCSSCALVRALGVDDPVQLMPPGIREIATFAAALYVAQRRIIERGSGMAGRRPPRRWRILLVMCSSPLADETAALGSRRWRARAVAAGGGYPQICKFEPKNREHEAK